MLVFFVFLAAVLLLFFVLFWILISRLENRLSLTSSPPPPPTTPVSATMSHFSFSFQPSNPDSSSHPQSQHTPISLSSTSAFNVCSVAANRASENLILDPNDKERSKIELVEVCMDMLASNAYTTSSPLPLRPSMIDKLLNKDKSQTWIIGKFPTNRDLFLNPNS